METWKIILLVIYALSAIFNAIIMLRSEESLLNFENLVLVFCPIANTLIGLHLAYFLIYFHFNELETTNEPKKKKDYSETFYALILILIFFILYKTLM